MAAIAVTPGSGWSGATTVPNPIGTPGTAGYAGKAIARWDEVPYRRWVSPFTVGVVAFAYHGVPPVSVGVHGGAFAASSGMQWHPKNRVAEHVFSFDPSQYTVGSYEARARAVPLTAGQCRVNQGAIDGVGLGTGEHGLFMFMDPLNTMSVRRIYINAAIGVDATGLGTKASPFLTIKKAVTYAQSTFGNCDHVVVEMAAGDYDWIGGTGGTQTVTTSLGWLTFEGAPGALVRINSTNGGRIYTTNTCFRNLTRSIAPIGNVNITQNRWDDRCVLTAGYTTYFGGSWVTSCTCPGNIENAPCGLALTRGSVFNEILSDVFKGVRCAVGNVVFHNEDTSGSGFHADLWQFQGGSQPYENMIMYGNRCVGDNHSQGAPFIKAADQPDGVQPLNIATVGNLFEHDFSAFLTQIQAPVKHFLYWQNTLIGQSFQFRFDAPPNTSVGSENVSIRRNIFGGGFVGPDAGDLFTTIDSNNFSGGGQGTNASSGAVSFVDIGTDDYRPVAGQANVFRGTPLITHDINGFERVNALGAYELDSVKQPYLFDAVRHVDATKALAETPVSISVP